MWLTGRLVPDHKTIADFRKDNGTAIRKVCARFIALCRMIGLLTQPSVAIDGSKFKAVNNRDKNFTRAKMERRMAQIEESVARYLQQLDTADRQEPSEALTTKTNRLKEKIETLKEQMRRLELLKVEMLATPAVETAAFTEVQKSAFKIIIQVMPILYRLFAFLPSPNSKRHSNIFQTSVRNRAGGTSLSR